MTKLDALALYYKIKEARDEIAAPVDSLGCYVIGKEHTGETRKFQVLVSLLLSSQTKDEVTYAAVKRLNEKLGILTPENVIKAGEAEVHSCIDKVGYHNRKAVFLMEIARRVRVSMPTALEEVLKLPGIGRKMAYLYLHYGCDRNEGIGVDTHVHRISNRIGLVEEKNPEKTRQKLEMLFEKEEWPFVNKVLVGFGQVVCVPINPKCALCPVQEKCPYNQK